MSDDPLDVVLERRLRAVLENDETDEDGKPRVTPATLTAACKVALDYLRFKKAPFEGTVVPGSGFTEDE